MVAAMVSAIAAPIAPRAPLAPVAALAPLAPFAQSPAPTAKSTAPAVAPSDFQGMVAKYCTGCHNTRNPMPAGAPLALDTANYADPAADAATWERVIKKLGVGAMPPQGSPTPGHAELGRFRAALIASLDAAAAQKP